VLLQRVILIVKFALHIGTLMGQCRLKKKKNNNKNNVHIIVTRYRNTSGLEIEFIIKKKKTNNAYSLTKDGVRSNAGALQPSTYLRRGRHTTSLLSNGSSRRRPPIAGRYIIIIVNLTAYYTRTHTYTANNEYYYVLEGFVRFHETSPLDSDINK